MEFKGTKGVWITCEEYKGMILTDSGSYSPNAMLKTIATEEELKANAQLIATAPELLKVLIDTYNNCNLSEYEKEEVKKVIKKATTI